MAGNAKPRKKYRPKPKLANPMAWLLEGFYPIDTYPEHMNRLRMVNANGLDCLVRGLANTKQINDLLAAHNMTVALVHLKLGEDYTDRIPPAHAAFLGVIERAKDNHKYICTGPEIAAIKDLMELHEAQLSACTMERFERAIAVANQKKLPLLFKHSVKVVNGQVTS